MKAFTALALASLLAGTGVMAQQPPSPEPSPEEPPSPEPSPGPSPPEPYLLGYWKGDGDAYDYSGYGNHGIKYGDVSYNENGIVGDAFSFGGGWVDLGNSTDFNFGAEDFTVQFWVNFTGFIDNDQEFQVLVEKFRNGYFSEDSSDGSITGWSIYKANGGPDGPDSGSLGVSAGDGTANFFETLSTDSWHQVTVTRSADRVKYYVNGTLQSEDDVFPQVIPDSDHPLLLGRRSDDREFFAKALLDEIKIYRGALDEEKIAESFVSVIYNSPMYDESPTSAPSYYKAPTASPTPPYYMTQTPTASPNYIDEDVLVFKYFIGEVIEAIGRLEKCRNLTCVGRRSRRLFRVFRRAARNELITREQFNIMAEIIKLATTEKKREIEENEYK